LKEKTANHQGAIYLPGSGTRGKRKTFLKNDNKRGQEEEQNEVDGCAQPTKIKGGGSKSRVNSGNPKEESKWGPQ